VRRLASLLAAPTVALVAALMLLPGRTALVLRVYLLVAGAVLLGALLAELARTHPAGGPSRFDAALRRPRRRHGRLAALAKLEREVALAGTSAFDVHFRLRPTLRDIAAQLLARRGVDLDRQPEAARRILGDEAWELVREDREPPSERFGPGLEPERLRRVVESLEAV
jgi:hypothetical protein